MNLSELRLSYTKGGLIESEMDADPLGQFELWMTQAISMDLIEPNAMTLATCDESGQPSARIVLLKMVDERGFVFYTNFESRKGRQIGANPRVALLFYWDVLERQVRVEGDVSKVSDEESDDYFVSRPVGHQLGAWASHQSSVVQGREELDETLASMASRFASSEVPRPTNWGGYLVTPKRIEFWQGRPNRMHDRIEYIRVDHRWSIRRLAP